MSAPIFLAREAVERLLTPQACLDAVEHAFRLLGEGRASRPAVLAMHAEHGTFHVKAGMLDSYFAAKLNGNFPGNGARGLPTIQGAVILSDATNGTPLAIMDSGAITALRTAAASALAAKHLARKGWRTLAIVGCGGQADAHLRALRPHRAMVCDIDRDKANAFARDRRLVSADLARCLAEAEVIVTCTSAKRWFVARDMVRPGTFIAAVGADNEEKQEIQPELLAAAKVVTDLTAQAAAGGDLRHAIAAGLMAAKDVHAELGEIVCGKRSSRESDDEIIVFDSTGTGLQDVAAAIAAYRRASHAPAPNR
ncbi:MAG TPA: ornithine cyclodeaminase family protein [Burkholderiales bacterium]|nr:ornithine cyclodeaminase family protein [Burkholderiales bacterium]